MRQTPGNPQLGILNVQDGDNFYAGEEISTAAVENSKGSILYVLGLWLLLQIQRSSYNCDFFLLLVHVALTLDSMAFFVLDDSFGASAVTFRWGIFPLSSPLNHYNHKDEYKKVLWSC